MRQGTPGFVGARLRQGREARAISAAKLSEDVGVTRAAISQYEHGLQSPSPATMSRICEVLQLPLNWFMRPSPPRELGHMFYRCMASTTKTARLRAQCRHEWLVDIAGILHQYVKMPAIKVPQFKVPDSPEKICPEFIDELATETRRSWGLMDGPISNVVWLLENHGCIVSRIELLAESLDAFSSIEPATGRPIVVLGSGKASASRSRFDAAHELGHLILHRHLSADTLTSSESFKLIENQAHRFAGSFLLPAESFGDEVGIASLDRFRGLKERWRVSISAMIMRAHNLNLISDAHHRQLMIGMSRRRWRTREPLDDTLEPERPRFLKKCIELLVTRGVVHAMELPLLLGLPPEDLEAICGLETGYLGGAEAEVKLLTDRPDEPSILRFTRDEGTRRRKHY